MYSLAWPLSEVYETHSLAWVASAEGRRALIPAYLDVIILPIRDVRNRHRQGF